MSISFYAEEVAMPEFDENNVTEWIAKVIREKGFSTWNMSFIFCTDEYLLNINRQYLNHDYYTDVITFDYSENKLISGDIFISVDMIKYNAEKFSKIENNELLRVMIHGVLHLCGFKDKTNTQKEEMTKQENLALSHIIS